MKLEVELDLEKVLSNAWENSATRSQENELLEIARDFIARHGEAGGRTYYAVTSLKEAEELVEALSE